MTHDQALKAYTTIITLGKRAKGKSAFALFTLKRQLKEIIDFQAEEELKLVEKYEGTVENGYVKIPDEEKRKQFLEEKRELGSMTVDLQSVKVDPELIDDITLDEVEALYGFVEFE